MRLNTFTPLAAKLNLASVGKPVLAGAVALAVMVAVFAGRAMISAATANQFEVEPARESSGQTGESGRADPGASVFVHVSGSVASPGLVEVSEGARVADAVQAAGGFADDAARDAVNLARVVQDGEQIAIPSAEQAVQQAQDPGGGAAGGGGAGQQADGKVNINTATSAELQALPGVGAATAAKIVDYRQSNGPFASCEDLKGVSGIGEKKFEAIADLICV